MKNLFGLLIAGSITLAACGGTKQEAKTAAAVPPPPLATADAGVVATATPDAAPITDANVTDAPSAPEAGPPSARPAVIQVVWDGLTREVAEGETFSVDGDQRRQLFFYSNVADNSCSNVNASGLIARSMAGICQIGFLPLEQKFQKGEERSVSISVNFGGTNTVRSFRVARR